VRRRVEGSEWVSGDRDSESNKRERERGRCEICVSEQDTMKE